MFSPLHGYLEREFMGMYQVNFATPAGIAVTLDSTNTAPLSGSIYGATYGDVVAATTNTGASTVGYTTRELGWLLQPVTASGPSLLNILVQVYDESIPQGATAVVCMSKTGALIATDQYETSGGQAIKFDGTVALNTACSINAGLVRTVTTDDITRLLFQGKIVQRNLTLASFLVC
jgi:hypothetical protein